MIILKKCNLEETVNRTASSMMGTIYKEACIQIMCLKYRKAKQRMAVMKATMYNMPAATPSAKKQNKENIETFERKIIGAYACRQAPSLTLRRDRP